MLNHLALCLVQIVHAAVEDDLWELDIKLDQLDPDYDDTTKLNREWHRLVDLASEAEHFCEEQGCPVRFRA